MKKKAFVTGLYGQDGAYLSYYLTSLGYDVYGLARRTSNPWRIKHLFKGKNEPTVIYGDLTEAQKIEEIIVTIKPNEIYNLAAQSHVGYSFDNPHVTTEVNYLGYLNILNSVKTCNKNIKIYQAGTSELFGYNNGKALNESCRMQPKSPYAIAKLASYWAGINARKEGVFVANGILFNHESPLRGEDFVTRKITKTITQIKTGVDKVLRLGNLQATRDWGHARDYVQAMHLMLQQTDPDDFVIGTGKNYSVEKFLMEVCVQSGMQIKIKGTGKDQVWYWKDKPIMMIDEEFYRPNDVEVLLADSTKANTQLNWRPEVSFKQLVKEMIDHEKNCSLYDFSI